MNPGCCQSTVFLEPLSGCQADCGQLSKKCVWPTCFFHPARQTSTSSFFLLIFPMEFSFLWIHINIPNNKIDPAPLCYNSVPFFEKDRVYSLFQATFLMQEPGIVSLLKYLPGHNFFKPRLQSFKIYIYSLLSTEFTASHTQ